MAIYEKMYQEALDIGLPPEIRRLFPDSKALIVSGAWLRDALFNQHKIILAANARNPFVISGVLKAAQKADSAVIIEIAKSECGYCAVNFKNLASLVNQACNDLGITIPVVIHADHYSIKNEEDLQKARSEIPEMLKNGLTSIAIDASHLSNVGNAQANIQLGKIIPYWIGLETEVGEIKGSEGLSTVEEATFLIEVLNVYGIYPDFIALNNGTTHGIEKSDAGIQVDLTAEIHKTLLPYGVAGAQHGTSGNSFERLSQIREQTNTLKANVATALQFLTWFVKVNEYGNAERDENGEFILIEDAPPEFREVWSKMVTHAKQQGWSGGDYKKLNKEFNQDLMDLPDDVKDQMVKRVEDFAYHLMTEVFCSVGTATDVVEAILTANSYAPDPTRHVKLFGNNEDWQKRLINKKGESLDRASKVEGNFDD